MKLVAPPTIGKSTERGKKLKTRKNEQIWEIKVKEA
jgi:hypothetical protein